MPLTSDEVKKIAHLARLDFSEEELLAYTQELSKILDYFQELQRVDTSSVTPTFHPLKKKTPLREDEVRSFENRKGLLENAPELKETSIIVPKVVKAP